MVHYGCLGGVLQTAIGGQTVTEKKEETIARKKIGLCEQYSVKNGDSLWWIAKFKDLYNDPFLWPIIYEANSNQIKNPNIIYPGQRLTIPRRGYTLDNIKMIKKKAGAPQPYLPQQRANIPLD